MMYAESVSMMTKLANKVLRESDAYAAFGIGLAIGYLSGLTICVALLH